MKKQSLNGAWLLTIPETSFADVPATVPGSVYNDLYSAGLIEDPFYRDNENSALKLMDNDFIYSRTFEVTEDMLKADKVLLHADGLDTLATIIINAEGYFTAENMHRVYEYDIKSLLHPGSNDITIKFDSPTRFIKEAYAEDPADGSSDAMVGFPLLRKAHCMFGWDWGPRLPDAGIWRDISIIGIEKARIDNVHIRQNHSDGEVTVNVKTYVENISADNIEVKVSVTAPDGTKFEAVGENVTLSIDNPLLWWPAGYGDQPLYTVETVLLADGTVTDCSVKRIGLRTLTMNTEKDEWGNKFCHRVNGIDIFAMGADYIPEDNLLPRVNKERTRRLLEDAKAANMNTIRVWGGGYYPDDFFYDICDELGLLVWQDFMFACAVYNLTDRFEENIRAEFTDNIRRLRHHASLALWCGNNEMEQFVSFGMWLNHPRQKSDYIKMYEYILPKMLKEEDPDTFYWPASPSSGGSFDEPMDENRGDMHYWDVWHGKKPFTEYRKFFFRYTSEFGFQSFPCMETINSFTEPEDRNVYSYVMEKHQRNASANGVISSYLSQMYLYPSTLDSYVYASQLLQAQAMQYAVEHWRRNRGRCMGAIVWQLNDCWPVVSWASLDYYGRWKALHYYEKRFFAPVLISAHEEGILSQNTNVNAEPFDLKKTVKLNVSNESFTPFDGTVTWSLRKSDSSVISEGAEKVHVDALSTVWLKEMDFSDEDTYDCYFWYELKDSNGHETGSGSVLFCAPKHFKFKDPGLTVKVENDEIVVTCNAYARSVEIQCGADVVLEDNYFDMNKGTKRVKIVRGEVTDVTARSVYDIR